MICTEMRERLEIKNFQYHSSESSILSDKWHGKPYYSLNAYLKNTYGKRIKVSSSVASAMKVATYWKCRYFTDHGNDIHYGLTGGNDSNAITLDAETHTFIGSENCDFVSICRYTNSTSTIDLTIEWIPVS